MKKLLLASIVLSLCSLSIVVFQLSCTKTVHAQPSAYTLPPATTATLGGVIVGSGLAVSSNGTLTTTPTTGLTQLNKIAVELGYANDSVLIVNYDGSNPTQVTLPVPAGQSMAYEGQDVILSPDGKTLFFQTVATAGSNNVYYIYSCNVDGTGRKLVYTSRVNPSTPLLIGAY